MKMSSVDFFKTNTETFNFIYVDESHVPDVIVNDMEESFKVLENSGIMWCDDYLGGPDVPDAEKPIKQAMDKYTGQYKVILKSYQIAIQKINADAT
jgi:predicted O-methyltransferase YrrM